MTDIATPVPPLCCGTLLTVQTAGSRIRRFAELLGHVEYEFLALRRSRSHPGDLPALRLQLGDTLLVRYLENGTAYGFRVRVLRVLQEPELLVFTSFPDSTQAHSVRSEERIACMLPCCVELGGDPAGSGLLLDVSPSGCQLALPLERALPEEGTQLALSLTLPDSAEPVRLVGDVRRTQSRQAGHRVGMQFHENAATVVEAVRRLTALLQ